MHMMSTEITPDSQRQVSSSRSPTNGATAAFQNSS
jgi:hypothetical protein